MSENELKPNANGSSGEGRGQQNSEIAFGKRLLTAYGAVSAALGAIGGAVPFVGSVVKSDEGQAIYSSLCVVVLVLVIAVGMKLAKFGQRKVHLTVGVIVAAVAVSGLAGAAIAKAVQGSNSPAPGMPPVAPTSGAPSAPATSGPSTSASTPDSSPSSSAPTSAAPCPQPLTITSPKAGAAIVGHNGVTLGISACGLQAGDVGYLFDQDVEGGSYGLDNGGPVVRQNGTSTFLDAPVGAPGDVNTPVKLTLVLADQDCVAAVQKLNFNDDNNPVTVLPAACKIESQVEVSETW